MGDEISKIEALRQSAMAVIDGTWTFTSLSTLLTTLVQAAESIYEGVGKGADKHKAVKEIWDEMDEKYHIIDSLDEMIKLPWWAEPFDGKVLRLLIDFLISDKVNTLNLTGVFKH